MTVADIITYAKISMYLASNDVSNGGLYGAPPNPNLPYQINIILDTVEQRYTDEGSPSTPSASLYTTSEYLKAWCKQYFLQAQALVNSGGAIPGTGGQTLYGYPISGTYIPSTIGEYILNLGIPSNAVVVWAQKSILTLPPSDWSWDSPNLTLLNGIQLGELEPLNYMYVLPI